MYVAYLCRFSVTSETGTETDRHIDRHTYTHTNKIL